MYTKIFIYFLCANTDDNLLTNDHINDDSLKVQELIKISKIEPCLAWKNKHLLFYSWKFDLTT